MAVNSKKSTDIQSVAKNFFEQRNDQNYSQYYQAFAGIAKKQAAAILKGDVESQEDIVSKVMIKMWENTEFVFDDSKPHSGYIATLASNFAKVYFNSKSDIRKKRVDNFENFQKGVAASKSDSTGAIHLDGSISRYETTEMPKSFYIQNFSDFRANDSEDNESDVIVENIGLKYRDQEENIELNFEYECMVAMIKEICKERSETINASGSVELKEKEFVEFVFESLQISAKLYLKDENIENVSYSQLKDKYGFNSEGAIKSRIHRIREELKERQNQIHLYKRFLSGERNLTGICRVMNEIDITDILNLSDNDLEPIELNTYTKLKFPIKNGKIHGEFIEYYPNFVVKTRAFYCHGIRHGSMIKYDELGNKTAEICYSNDKKHGDLKTFKSDGSLNTHEIYEKGKLMQYTVLDDEIKSIEIKSTDF